MLVVGVAFDEEGNLIVEYLIPAKDTKVNGLVLNHRLLIPCEGYDVEVSAVREAVERALTKALKDFEVTESIVIEEDEDEASPYDNPKERSET